MTWMSSDAAKVKSQQRMAQSERHVAEGRLIVARQQAIVAELEQGGHNATLARELLVEFQRVLEIHIADRDRLRSELSRDVSESEDRAAC